MSTEQEATPPALLPCPFCGGAVEFYQETPSAYFQVICPRGCPDGGKTSAAAARLWNRRADSFDTMRDALRRIAETISKSTLLEQVNRGHYLLQDISTIANAALAAIDGKDS